MRTYIEVKEVEAMERNARSLRDKLLIRLLFRLGCRVSEALELTLQDINLDSHEVSIIHLKSRTKILCSHCQAQLSRYHRFCPVCGSRTSGAGTQEQKYRRRRILPIDCETLRMLEDYIREEDGKFLDGKQPIFGINRHSAWRIVRDCAERAGISSLVNPETGRVRGVSPHRLRDAFAVHAVKANDSGDGLRLLQEHLGHASFDTTAKYRKVAGEEHRRWYESLWNDRNK